MRNANGNCYENGTNNNAEFTVNRRVRKVLVIGSPGAGKSTFSRRLGEITGLPVVHLDTLFWLPNWVEMERPAWLQKVAEVLKGERWIVDGNYGGTMEMRLAACDTAIFLDLPRIICAWRVFKRSTGLGSRTRPDMADGCTERVDLKFLLWTWNYPNRSRPSVERRLRNVNEEVHVVRLRSQAEIDAFLREIERHKPSG